MVAPTFLAPYNCAKRARASSTSRILMATDRKCSMPSASSAWRARF